ncbi:MAG: tetratricopeptide repeat protein, partial [Planctomycetota bacterium]
MARRARPRRCDFAEAGHGHPDRPAYRFSLARALAWAGRREAARAEYEALSQHELAQSPVHWTERGDIAVALGRHADAAAAYGRALDLTGDAPSTEVRKKRALALHWAGDRDRALPILRELHASRPSDEEIGIALAREYRAREAPDRALSVLQAIREAGVPHPLLLAEEADIALDLGDFVRAERLYARARADQAEPSTAFRLRHALARMRWGAFYAAEADLRALRDPAAPSSEADLLLGRLLRAEERYAEARALFLGRLLRDRSDRDAREELARTLLADEDPAEALAVLDRPPAPDAPDAPAPGYRLLRARCLFRLKRYGEAEALLRVERGTHRRKDSPDAQDTILLLLARTLHTTGRTADAVALLREYASDPRSGAGYLLSRWTDTPDATTAPSTETRAVDWMARADLAAELADRRAAEAYWRRALALASGNARARWGLARTLASTRRYAEALALYDGLLADLPDARQLVLEKARMLAWMQRYGASLDLYGDLQKRNPGDHAVRREMARVQFWAKHPREGQRTYAEAMTPPVDTAARRTLADAPPASDDEAILYDWTEAALAPWGLTESAILHHADAPAAIADLWAGYRRQKAFRLEQAAKVAAFDGAPQRMRRRARQAVAFEPRNAEMRFDHAQAAAALGLDAEAIDAYRALLARIPLHSLAEDTLQYLVRRQAPSLGLETWFWHEEGRGALSRIRQMRQSATGGWSLPDPDARLVLRLDRWRMDADGANPTDGTGIHLQYERTLSDAWRIAFGGGGRVFDDDATADDTWVAHARASYRHRDRFVVTAGWARDDRVTNRFALVDGQQRDRTWLTLSVPAGRRAFLEGTARALHDSDGNRGEHHTLETSWTLFPHPRQLTLYAIGDWRDTDKETGYAYAGDELVDLRHPFFLPYLALTLSVFLWTVRARRYRPGEILLGQLLIAISFPIYLRAAVLALLGRRGRLVTTPQGGS